MWWFDGWFRWKYSKCKILDIPLSIGYCEQYNSSNTPLLGLSNKEIVKAIIYECNSSSSYNFLNFLSYFLLILLFFF